MLGDRYRSFVFTPADLAEDVDLPLEAKKEILYLHARLRELDHWQLLGVRWNAPVEAVRAAYLDKVKVQLTEIVDSEKKKDPKTADAVIAAQQLLTDLEFKPTPNGAGKRRRGCFPVRARSLPSRTEAPDAARSLFGRDEFGRLHRRP